MDRAGLELQQEFATLAARSLTNRDLLDQIISEWTRGFTAHATELKLQELADERPPSRTAVTYATIRNWPAAVT